VTLTLLSIVRDAPGELGTLLAANDDIFVDASALPGGNGTSPATAYRTIGAAVADANLRAVGSTIHIAEGTYSESPTITITRDGVTLLGDTVLSRDAAGLATGSYSHGAIVQPAVPVGTPVPSGSALIRVNASNVTITGLVLDGGVPHPALNIGGGPLLMVDGAPTAHALTNVSIQGNVMAHHGQLVLLRLAGVVVSGNYFGRGNMGLVAYSSFEHDTLHPDPEVHLLVSGNRIVDLQNTGVAINGGVGSLTAPTFASVGLTAGPGVQHVEIAQNDISRNGTGIGSLYPQPIQYSGLLFVMTSSDATDPSQPSRIEASVHDNRFLENAYALSISQRVALLADENEYTFNGQLFGNSYCGSGLNDGFFNFGLNSQSHGVTSGATSFRYGQLSTYTITANGDGLTTGGFDYDHPMTDPRLPTTAMGTLLLNDTLVFNGTVMPAGVQLSRPVGLIDVGVTPTLSLVGPSLMIVGPGIAYVDPGATALDGCEGNLSGQVVVSGAVDMTTSGTYVLTYDVANAVGTRAASVHRTVIVDTTSPVLTLPPNITTPQTLLTGAAVVFTASATDQVSGSVPVTCNWSSGAIFPVGMTTVSCSATDGVGNTATGSFVVSVAAAACTINPVTIGNTSWNAFTIPSGSSASVWVNAHIGKPSGISKTTTSTLRFTNGTLTIGGVAYPVPDGIMTFDPAAPATITTTFNATAGRWETLVNPSSLSDEIFLTGAAIPVSAALATSAKATWSFAVLSDAIGLSFPWQWSAAAYTYWSTDWNDAAIQPYHTNDHAGTPLNLTIQHALIGGPRGGGGSNYTGSWSATGTGTCQ
jgi:hypothetical protein